MTFCASESRNNEFAHLVVHSAILYSIRFYSSSSEGGLELIGTQDWFPFIHRGAVYRVFTGRSWPSGIGNGRLACWTSENLEVEIDIHAQVCAPFCLEFILGTKTCGKKCGGFVPSSSLHLSLSRRVETERNYRSTSTFLSVTRCTCVQLAWISLLTDVSSSFGASRVPGRIFARTRIKRDAAHTSTFYSWNKIHGKMWIKILQCRSTVLQVKAFTTKRTPWNFMNKRSNIYRASIVLRYTRSIWLSLSLPLFFGIYFHLSCGSCVTCAMKFCYFYLYYFPFLLLHLSF